MSDGNNYGAGGDSSSQLPQQMQGMQIGAGGRGRGRGRGRGFRHASENPMVGGGHQPQQDFPGMPAPRQQPQQQERRGPWGPTPVDAPPAVGAWGRQAPQQQQQPAQQAPWGQKPAAPAAQQRQVPIQHVKQEKVTAPVEQQQERPVEKKETPRQEVPVPVTAIDKKTMSESEKKRLSSLIPMRKNPNKAGTQGRPIRVRTNMMAIEFGKNFKANATHYDIKFDPDRPKFLKRLAFNAVRKQHFPNNWPAFDERANVYSAGNLPFGVSLEVEVQIFDEERQQDRPVKVTMQKANEIRIDWLKEVRPGLKEHEKDQTTMQVLDVILRCASYDRAVMVGRSFFQRPTRPVDLGTGMELWTGLFQSAVLGWKPYFNVDVAHKGFPTPQPVIAAIISLCSSFREPCSQLTRDIFNRNRDKIDIYLKTLKVVYQLPGKPSTKRTFGVNGFDRSPREAEFKLANGEFTTVLNYFAGAKNYRIQYPDIPCLWVGSRNKEPRILLPPELCTIVSGLVTNRKLDEQQTRVMIKEAATKPDDRANKIMEAYNAINFNQNPTMKEFGISVTGKFTEVDARVLQAPGLRDQNDIRVAKGVWTANKFHTAQGIENKKWTILNLSRLPTNKLVDFVRQIRNNVNGMSIGEPFTPFGSVALRGNDIRLLLNYLDEMKKQGIRLVIVVIPGRLADVYPKVKQIAELRVGILTQCIKDDTMDRKMNPATAGNILLKLNSKLNGINHTFAPASMPACLKVPTMFIGADVTHPSPDQINIPSIAAVAASFDKSAFKYNVTIKLQPARQEIISDLAEIVYNQLRRFMDTNGGKKPQKIVFYRDGVSEGQFPQIMHFELQAIRTACSKIETIYKPQITFLVVQKRHHIRLFPADRRNSDDRAGNVQAGTIVDTEITHPSHIDFYLVSHASIQGTAKPTKYRCLWDDSDMSEDEIEKLTYYLCHMFARCTRSVSYPAPTYYAHLAAFRARSLIHNIPIQMTNLANEQRMKLTLHEGFHQSNPMFFV